MNTQDLLASCPKRLLDVKDIHQYYKEHYQVEFIDGHTEDVRGSNADEAVEKATGKRAIRLLDQISDSLSYIFASDYETGGTQ